MLRSRLLACSNGLYHQRPSPPQHFRRKIALADSLASPQQLTPVSRSITSSSRSGGKFGRAAATGNSSYVSSVLSGMESISRNLDQMSLRERSNDKHYSPYRLPSLRPSKPGKVALPSLSELGLLDYGRQPTMTSIPIMTDPWPFIRWQHLDTGLNIRMERLSLKEDPVHPPDPSFEYHLSARYHCGFEPQLQGATSPMIYG